VRRGRRRRKQGKKMKYSIISYVHINLYIKLINYCMSLVESTGRSGVVLTSLYFVIVTSSQVNLSTVTIENYWRSLILELILHIN